MTRGLRLTHVSRAILFAVCMPALVRGQESGTSSPVNLPPMVVSGTPSEPMPPGSTSILSSETLNDAEIRSLDQLSQQAPNLITEGGGTRSFNNVYGMRGMVNTLYFSDPAVAIIVDDVAYPTPESAVVSLNAVNSVQILRGPQSSQFGVNAPGGAIVINPAHPEDSLRLDARAGYGTYSEQEYMLHLSGPVIPGTLSLGGTFSYGSRNGFVVNQLLSDRPDNQEGYAGRVELCFQPTPDWQVRVTSDNQYYDDGVQRFTHLGQDPFVENYDFNGQNRTDTNVEALHISHTADDYTATSITSYLDYELNPSSLDFDFSPVPLENLSIYYHQQAYTEELKFVSNQQINNNPQWRAGLYLSAQNLHVAGDADFPLFESNDTSHLHLMTWQSALYGESSWALPEDFVVTAGGRVEATRRTATLDFLSVTDMTSHQDEGRTFLNAAPKVTLAWTGSPHLQPYVDTGLTYRNGGFSYFQANSFFNDYSNEQTWSNEIGINSNWLNGAVTGNLAGFWNETRNYQLEIYEAGDFGLINAPRVTTRGCELSSTQRVSSWFSLTENFGWTDATFDRFSFPVTGADDDGNHVPFVPEYNGMLAAEIRHPDGYMARVEGVITGDTFFDSGNSDLYRQDAYAFLNLKVGYEKKSWGIYVFGKNLTNTQYYTLEVSPGQVGIPGNPTELGFEVTACY